MGVTALQIQEQRFLASASSYMNGGIPSEFANVFINHGRKELGDLYSGTANTLVNGLSLEVRNVPPEMGGRSPTHIAGIPSASVERSQA